MKAELLGDGDAGYHLAGSLTYQTVPLLREQPAPSFARSTGLDLARVERIDSAGLALLVEWTCAAAREGKRLELKNTPELLRSLIEVSGLTEVLSVTDD